MFARWLGFLGVVVCTATAAAQEVVVPPNPSEAPQALDAAGIYYQLDPLSLRAFDAETVALAPLFSLRQASGIELLPRPANPKDILRRDPVVTTEAFLATGYVPEEDVMLLQIQRTPFALDLDVQANIDTTYDTGYTGKTTFAPKDIALDGTTAARRRGEYRMSARTTLLALDLQSPTDMPAQAYAEVDFEQADATFDEEEDVRLRHLFGRVGGRELHLIGGQQWSLFGDQYARPISLVSGQSPAGAIAHVPLQLRLTAELAGNWNTALAVEEPLTTDFVAITPATDVRLQRVPNFVGRLRYDAVENISFVQAAFLLRGLGIEDAAGREHVELGWGVSAIAVRPLAERNTLQLGFVSGRGIGDYIFGLGGLTAAGGPDNGDLRALQNTGAYAGYIHRWSDSLATHAAYGWAFAETTPDMPADAAKKLQNGWVNLIWQATPQVALAIEYDYGMREVRDGTSGENHRMQFTISTAPQKSRSDVSAFGRL